MEKSFVFTEKMQKVIDAAPVEYQLDIYEAITQYGLYGEINADGVALAILIALQG